MDLGKITVLVTRDFPETNYIFIPARKQSSHVLVEVSITDSLSQNETNTIQNRTVDAVGSGTTSPVSTNEIKNVGLESIFKGYVMQGKGNELQFIFKNNARETVTDSKMSLQGQSADKITSGARINGAKTMRKKFVTKDKKENGRAVKITHHASNAAIDSEIATNRAHCREKLKASSWGLDNAESGLQCILIGQNSKSISTVKLAQRTNGILICPEIMSNNGFKCTNEGVGMDFENCYLEYATTNDEVEGRPSSSEKNLRLSENIHSLTHDVKDNDSGIDSEEAESQSHTSDYDEKKEDCETWKQSALCHQNIAVSRSLPSDGEDRYFGGVDSRSVTHEYETIECRTAVDEIDNSHAMKKRTTCDVAEKKEKGYGGQMLSPCVSITDIDDILKDDCDVNKVTNRLITHPQFLRLSETDIDVMTACSKTLNRIIKTLELCIEFDDDNNYCDIVDNASRLLRNHSTKSVLSPPGDGKKCSDVVNCQSINVQNSLKLDESDNCLKADVGNKTESVTSLTAVATTTTIATIDPKNHDTDLRKSPNFDDPSSSTTATLSSLPVGLRRVINRQSKDCILDKSFGNLPLDLTRKKTTVGDKPQGINPSINLDGKQLVPINSSFEPISPRVTRRPIYEPISPPGSPITISNSNEAVSRFFYPSETILPAICNTPVMGRSYELISPEPNNEEVLKKKAEKEFLKELWQEGSGRLVVAESNDKEIIQDNCGLDKTKKQASSTLIGYRSPSHSNFTPHQSMSQGAVMLPTCKNGSMKDRPMLRSLLFANAPVFNSAIEQQWDNTYSNQHGGLYGEIERSYHPGQHQKKLSDVKNSAMYYTTAGSYGTLRTTHLNADKLIPSLPRTTNIGFDDPYRRHPTTYPLQRYPAAKSNATNKAASQLTSQKCASNNNLRDISNDVNLHCESTISSDDHRQQPKASGPQNMAFTSTVEHSDASYRKCAYDELRKLSNGSRLNCRSATPSLHQRMQQSVATGPRNMFSSAPNYNGFFGNTTMLDGAIKHPGLSTQDVMPPSAPAPSHHSDATENDFRQPIANTITQEKCQSSTPQTVNSACYSNILPKNISRIQLFCSTPPSTIHIIHHGQPKTQQHGQYLQKSRAYTNGLRISAQQQAQFLHPGKVPATTIESGNRQNQHLPPSHGNFSQVYAATANSATAIGIPSTVGGLYVMSSANEHNTYASASHVAMSHHKTQPAVLRNPSDFRSIPSQSNFESIQQHAAEAIGRSGPNWSQPVQTSSNQQPILQNQPIQYQQPQISRNLPPTTAGTNQSHTVHHQSIRFQPVLTQNVPTTMTSGNRLPTLQNQQMRFQQQISNMVPPTTAGTNQIRTVYNQPVSSQLELSCSLSMKRPCWMSGGAVNAKATVVQERVPNHALVLQNCQIINSPTIVNQIPRKPTRPEPIPVNPPNVSRLLAGNTIPGDMLMTTQVGLPRSKKNNLRGDQTIILQYSQRVEENQPVHFTSQATEVTNANKPISQSNSSRPPPFVQLAPSSKRFSSTPAPSQLPVESQLRLISSVTKVTSVEHASTATQTSTSSESEQSTLNSMNHDERVESPTSENQNEDDSYGYDYNTLAKALQQSKQSKTNGTSSSVKAEVKRDPEGDIQRRLLPPSSPSTTESEIEIGFDDFGYDYESMVKARQKAEQQQTQSNHTETSVEAGEKTADFQTTPMKSQNTNQPFDTPSMVGDRKYKGIIPPISSDSDSDVESDPYRQRNRSKIRKRKKKWRRIIDPSDSSDSSDSEELGIKVHVHDPESPMVDDESTMDAAGTCTNTLKRKQDDLSEKPAQKRLKCNISPSEFAYMASCRVILPRIEDVFVSLKTLTHFPADVKESSDALTSETVLSHPEQSAAGWAKSDHELASFRQLNHNMTTSVPPSRSDKSESSSRNANFSDASKQSWRENQTNFSDTDKLSSTSVAGDGNSDTTDDVGSSPSFESGDNQIENSLPHETYNRWQRNRKDSFETDTTVTTQSYFSDLGESTDLSNIEENESPYHSEEDDCCDDDELPKKGTVFINNKKGERSIKKTKTVTFEGDFLREKENTSKHIQDEYLPTSDEDDDITSSYTSSNSGSPVKFDRLGKHGEWPFSDGNESITETDDPSNKSRSCFAKKTLYKQDDIGHQLNYLVKDKKSLVTNPEMRLTKALKMRNRRTNKSRERRKKMEYLKKVGLHGAPVNLIHNLKLLANSSIHPARGNVQKTKMSLEGYSNSSM